MKSLWVTAPFQFELREVEVPRPQACEVLIKVDACGICGTDLHLARNGAAEPTALGHEVVGMVAEVGSAVVNVKPGDKVLLENFTACYTCRHCRMGEHEHCRNQRTYYGSQAGFAEYLCVHESMVQPYDGLDAIEAVLCEPLTVALHVTSVAEIPVAANVAVFGCGTIGLMAVAIARHLYGACRVLLTGATRRTERAVLRLRTGIDLGADVTVAVNEEDLVSAVREIAEEGMDRVILTAPPRTLADAVKISRFGGIIGLIGIEYGDGGVVSFDVNEFHFRKLQLRASHNIPNIRFPLAVDLLRRRVIDPARLLTHVFALEDFAEAFRVAMDPNQPAIKVAVTC